SGGWGRWRWWGAVGRGGWGVGSGGWSGRSVGWGVSVWPLGLVQATCPGLGCLTVHPASRSRWWGRQAEARLASVVGPPLACSVVWSASLRWAGTPQVGKVQVWSRMWSQRRRAAPGSLAVGLVFGGPVGLVASAVVISLSTGCQPGGGWAASSAR